MITLEGRVEQFIRERQLMTREDLHLVALSGGADSVALLLVLKALNYRIEAVHCNFHLRGEESDRDENFVKSLCSQQGIHIHLIHFDTNAYASVHQVSVEMAARELRYRYFEQLRVDIGAETVCVAHHRDDAVETLLMNQMRGCGIHGLTGIRPKNGYVVRPLLCVSRKEIEHYLATLDQSYVTDSTNLYPHVLRNKVRLQLLPLIEQIYPGSIDNLARTLYYLSEAEKVYDAWFSTHNLTQCQCPSPTQIPVSSILSSPSPLCLLHEWLSPLGFNRTQTEQILAGLDGASGREFSSSTHTLVVDRDALVVAPIAPPMKSLVIPEPGTYRLDETARLRVEYLAADAGIRSDPHVATLDAAKVQFPLTLRSVQEGDRFQPFGMKGQKLVSDYLTDRKLNLIEKRRQQVVTDAAGNILWLVSHRPDHRYCVTDQTRKYLRISLVSD